MKICAIVLNYRNASRTEACLRSLAGQGLEMVLVVDNSADDAASAELARMQEQLGTYLDCALHLLRPDENLGFARGVNFALGNVLAGHCDSFLLINNDAVAMPGMVAKLVEADAALAAPSVVDLSGQPQPMLYYQRFFGLLMARGVPGSFPYLSGCCLLVRRDVLENEKLFDEDFFMYGEDAMLGWRLANSGKVFRCVNDAMVRHTSGASSRQGQFFYEYHTARAHVLLALKTWRTPLEIPLLLVSKCTGLTLRALLRSARFGSAVPLWAFILAWFPVKVRVP